MLHAFVELGHLEMLLHQVRDAWVDGELSGEQQVARSLTKSACRDAYYLSVHGS